MYALCSQIKNNLLSRDRQALFPRAENVQCVPHVCTVHLHLNFFLDRKDKTPMDLDPVQVRKHTKAEVGQTRESKTGNHRHLDIVVLIKGMVTWSAKVKVHSKFRGQKNARFINV